MKALGPRPPAPTALADPAKRAAWYADLRTPGGEILRRWGDDEIRRALYSLGGGECAWCGGVLERGWPVDHYLPKTPFPRLSYLWENLLPSCGTCNDRVKGDYRPPRVADDTLIDPALVPGTGERHYLPATVLPDAADRLVEPAAEDPAAHLVFEPAISGYRPVTRTGTITRDRFFPEKDFGKRLATLSDLVARAVKDASDAPDLKRRLDDLAAYGGRSFYIQAYARFWCAMTQKTHLLSAPS